MRDSDIIGELSNLKRRNAVVYKQMVFCNTRMQAFEKVLVGGGLWSRLILIMSPATFMAAVDKAQLVFVNEHDEALRQSEQATPLTVIQNGAVREVKVNGSGN